MDCCESFLFELSHLCQLVLKDGQHGNKTGPKFHEKNINEHHRSEAGFPEREIIGHVVRHAIPVNGAGVECEKSAPGLWGRRIGDCARKEPLQADHRYGKSKNTEKCGNDK